MSECFLDVVFGDISQKRACLLCMLLIQFAYICSMICFPNAKINLGLNVTEKRTDGFHNIETIFYPIAWCDALEVVETNTGNFNLYASGYAIAGKQEDNLLYKVYQLIKQTHTLPPINVYLQKALPMGAGLGGGSADAAFFINLLNDAFSLELGDTEKQNIAKQLGSDCAFFINNKPVFAYNKGDEFNAIDLDLSKYYIAVIYPNVRSNTKEAYSLVTPKLPQQSVLEIITQPIETWKDLLVNDFEPSIFSLYPIVKTIKENLYEQGAVYASMSGSGSAVYGLFNEKPQFKDIENYPHWIGKMM